jgi:hypothetical protein
MLPCPRFRYILRISRTRTHSQFMTAALRQIYRLTINITHYFARRRERGITTFFVTTRVDDDILLIQKRIFHYAGRPHPLSISRDKLTESGNFERLPIAFRPPPAGLQLPSRCRSASPTRHLCNGLSVAKNAWSYKQLAALRIAMRRRQTPKPECAGRII